MAKLLVSLLFFFIVSFSHARDLRSKDAIPEDLIQNSDSEASINFFPGEEFVESDPHEIRAEIEPLSTDSNPNPSEFSEIAASEEKETDHTHQTIQIIFRPINHQFPRRSIPLIFRRGRHGCRHHNRQISYGNDMIIAGDRSSFNPDAHQKPDREIPLKWSTINRVDQGLDSYSNDKEEDNKEVHHHHFHHRHGNEEEKDEREEEHKHKEKSGFVKSFRKFLKQFEF